MSVLMRLEIKRREKLQIMLTDSILVIWEKLKIALCKVNAYGILEGITFPLLFKIYKPRKRLKENEKYKTKPQLAIEIIKELIALGFNFQVVLADSLYGESRDFIEVLNENQLNFVVEDGVTTAF